MKYFLRISNMDQGNPDLTNINEDYFRVRIPQHLRAKPCNVKVLEAFVNSEVVVSEDESSFILNPDEKNKDRVVLLRSNIASNSYDTSTGGSNLILATCIFELLSKVVNEGNTENPETLVFSNVAYSKQKTLDLGLCSLPPVLEIERLTYTPTTNKLTRNYDFNPNIDPSDVETEGAGPEDPPVITSGVIDPVLSPTEILLELEYED